MKRYPTQGQVLTALHKGGVITVEYINEPRSAVRKRYRLSSDNRNVRPQLVDYLLKSGLIVANNDGLPGFGETQTYSIKRNLGEAKQ